jgi:hypothetical protein
VLQGHDRITSAVTIWARTIHAQFCETSNVHNERAQLSSATTTLEELLDRVSSTAEAVLAAGDESLASDLFEVERSLRTAHRRLVSATRRAG